MLRVVTRSVTRPYELFRVGGARSGDGPKSLRKLPLATDIDTRCGCSTGLLATQPAKREVLRSDATVVDDTWLKRSCQMSGELQPSELIYVPRGVPIHLSKRVHLVDEDWERARHQHVHLHRKVTLASTPVTVKQEGYDILMGQRDNPVPLQLQP
ncbi:unnamed protein product [Cladocopium goreaui]|uniref:Leucine-rich repeat protein SHOC-2 n=1 Tax=Cladocopium goreaui TaxID=2562237 RepID=A0A9P1FQA6_9DINO|nr:unnamed protein product [Cladocopium goreaui]